MQKSKTQRLNALATLMASTLVLAACGGGNGGSSQSAPASADTSAAANTGTGTTPTTTAASSAPVAAPESAAGLASSAPAPATDTTDTAKALAVVSVVSAPAPAPAPAPATTTSVTVTGTTYYVDSRTGSDSNGGTSASGPWKTLSKVAAAALKPGDAVLLACGATWNETLKLNVSGTSTSPILVSSYPSGCSNQPAIDGSTAIAPGTWSLHSGNIYKTSLATAPQQLVIGTMPMEIAHHPNRGFNSAQPTSLFAKVAANSDSVYISGRSRSTYLTVGSDLALPSGATITPGTGVRIRTNSWVLDESTVASVSGSKLSLTTPTSYVLNAGWGYFLTGQLWMLDSPKEWYYDATAKTLYAWMPDSLAPSNTVYAGQLATGVDLQSKQYIQVENLSVKLVGTGVNMRGSVGVVLRGSRIQNTAGMGIDAGASQYATIDSNVLSRTGSDAISGADNTTTPASGMSVTGNTISDSGVVVSGDTILSLPKASFAAIRSGKLSTVSGNSVTNTGNMGILPLAGSTVSDNSVYGACSLLDDCGGIYTASQNNNSVIKNNVVQHSRGAVDGKVSTMAYTQAQGIYLDELASGVTITGNTVTDADNGIQLHVASNNIVTGNRLYGNRRNQIWLQDTTTRLRTTGDVFGNTITGNEIVPAIAGTQGVLQTSEVNTDTSAFASYDLNRYFDRVNNTIASEHPTTGLTQYTFNQWRTAVTATGTPRGLDPAGWSALQTRFAPSLVLGPNVIPAAGIGTSTLTSWTIWSSSSPYGTVVQESCTPGTCIRYTPGAAQGTLSSPNFPVKQNQWYRMSFDLMTSTDNQAVPVVVRRGGGGTNGYERLSDVALSTVGMRTWKRVSFVFMGTKTVNVNDPVTGDLGGRLDFERVQPGQTINVANVEIVPITAAAAANRSDLLINAGSSPLNVDCPVSATAPAQCSLYARLSDDTAVAWPVTLAPHSSLIVYTRDTRLVDSDGDGIADSQDLCSSTPVGAAVDSSGCALGQAKN